jgi:hypothetical protein
MYIWSELKLILSTQKSIKCSKNLAIQMGSEKLKKISFKNVSETSSCPENSTKVYKNFSQIFLC